MDFVLYLLLLLVGLVETLSICLSIYLSIYLSITRGAYLHFETKSGSIWSRMKVYDKEFDKGGDMKLFIKLSLVIRLLI